MSEEEVKGEEKPGPGTHEKSSEWEPRVAELLEMGVEPQEIVEIVMREYYELFTGKEMKKLADMLKIPPLTVGRIKGIVTRERKAKARKEAKEEEKEKISDRELVAQKGLEGLEQIKKRRLEEQLSFIDGLSSKSKEWILSQWDVDVTVRRDPNELFRLLRSVGIKEDRCDRIVRLMIAIDREYADLLAMPTTVYYGAPSAPQQQREFRYETPPPPQRYGVSMYHTWQPQPQYPSGYIPPYQTPYQQYPQIAQPYMPQPAQTVTLEDIRRILREEAVSKHELENFKSEIAAATIERMDRKFKELKEGSRIDKLEQMVVEQGKRIESLLESIARGEIGGKKTPETTPELEALKTRTEFLERQLSEAREALKEATKRADEAERKRWEDRIAYLESEIKAAREAAQRTAVSAGEWKTDEGRLIATGLTEFASVLREKKPSETLAQVVGQIMRPQVPKEIMPEAKSKLHEILPPEYVG